MEKITKELWMMRDESYFKFHKKLIPNIPEDRIIGVRTPALRAYAKKVAKYPEVHAFMQELPHGYYEENNLHGTLLGLLYKDVECYLEELEKFLPYIDNWATCDMFMPKVFKKNKVKLFEYIKKWIKSDETYTVRYAIKLLMSLYLDDDFEESHMNLVSSACSGEYYVNMMVAWYFATAFFKQQKNALCYIEQKKLPEWVHNKSIQKARESKRISDEMKKYLNSLKIK